MILQCGFIQQFYNAVLLNGFTIWFYNAILQCGFTQRFYNAILLNDFTMRFHSMVLQYIAKN